MRKIYYLSTCDTCKKVLKQINLPESFEVQDIKKEPLTEQQLEELRTLSGSYEALFSKRARLYTTRDLKNSTLNENDFKALILEHYTFLKRPVIVHQEQVFIGSDKKTIEAVKKVM